MDKEIQIKKVQELLFLHGYYSTRITGDVDDNTKKQLVFFYEKMK